MIDEAMIGWVSFILFFLILASAIILDRKKVKREGLMLVRRTKKGRTLIDKVAKKSPKLWNIYSKIGVVIAIPALIFVSVFLTYNAYGIIEGSAVAGGVRLILPGPVSQPTLAPGVIGFPVWIWVIGIMSVLIVHEFSHGIVCRLEKIKIQSVGWALFFIIPGAFVEPDEKQLKKAKRSTKLKVYAAGSFANIVLASLILILFLIISPILIAPVQSNSIFFQTVENTSADTANMKGYPYESIIEINEVRTILPYNVNSVLSNHKPGDVIEIKTINNTILPYMNLEGDGLIETIAPKPAIVPDATAINTYTVTLSEHPEEEGRAYIGISILDIQTYSSTINPAIYSFFAIMLIWIFFFNLGIGLANLLPIKPLDGGLIFEVIAEKFSVKSATIVKTMTAIMLTILIFNLIGPMLI